MGGEGGGGAERAYKQVGTDVDECTLLVTTDSAAWTAAVHVGSGEASKGYDTETDAAD